MIEVPVIFKTASIALVSVGIIVGATLYIEDAHDALAAEHKDLVPHSEFDGHLAEQRVRTIFGYMDQIRASGPQTWLCDAMAQEFIELCTALPDHAMCNDRGEIIEQMGC